MCLTLYNYVLTALKTNNFSHNPIFVSFLFFFFCLKFFFYVNIPVKIYRNADAWIKQPHALISSIKLNTVVRCTTILLRLFKKNWINFLGYQVCFLVYIGAWFLFVFFYLKERVCGRYSLLHIFFYTQILF